MSNAGQTVFWLTDGGLGFQGLAFPLDATYLLGPDQPIHASGRKAAADDTLGLLPWATGDTAPARIDCKLLVAPRAGVPTLLEAISPIPDARVLPRVQFDAYEGASVTVPVADGIDRRWCAARGGASIAAGTHRLEVNATDLTSMTPSGGPVLDSTLTAVVGVLTGSYPRPAADWQIATWPRIQDAYPRFPLSSTVRHVSTLPPPPRWNIERIRQSLWVLECDTESIQGTAFSLENAGLVTCDHVLGPTTLAFRADSPLVKFPVRVKRRDANLDLALLEVEPMPTNGLHRGTADHLREQDHLAVAGFPNYQRGDTGLLSPGNVTGFRTIAAVRHVLVSASLIRGMSGAPAFDAAGNVVGVAVTGADRPDTAKETEKHAVIPIEALYYVGV